MKIVVLNTISGPVCWFFLDLLKTLADRGCSIAVYVSDPENQNNLLNLRHTNIRARHISVARRPSLIGLTKTVLAYRKIVRSENPGVVVTNNLSPGLAYRICAITLGESQRPKWVHFATGQVWAKLRWADLIPYFLDTLVLLAKNRLVLDSKSQYCFLKKNVPLFARRSEIYISNSVYGVRSEIVGWSSKSSILQQHPEVLKVGYIGRINKSKGIVDSALEFSHIVKGAPGLELHLFGDMEETLPLASLTNVYWHGYQSDVGKVLSSIDLLIVPSEREGFGNVVLEAAMFGVRAVVTPIYGLRDVAGHAESVVVDRECFWKVILELRTEILEQKAAYATRMKQMYREKYSRESFDEFYTKVFYSQTETVLFFRRES